MTTRRRLRIRKIPATCRHCGHVAYPEVWPVVYLAARKAERPTDPVMRVDCTRGCGRKILVQAQDVLEAEAA